MFDFGVRREKQKKKKFEAKAMERTGRNRY